MHVENYFSNSKIYNHVQRSAWPGCRREARKGTGLHNTFTTAPHTHGENGPSLLIIAERGRARRHALKCPNFRSPVPETQNPRPTFTGHHKCKMSAAPSQVTITAPPVAAPIAILGFEVEGSRGRVGFSKIRQAIQ